MVRIGMFGGIEFETTAGERKRFSVHWPEKTQEENDGAGCRDVAAEMNKKPAMGKYFQKIKLEK